MKDKEVLEYFCCKDGTRINNRKLMDIDKHSEYVEYLKNRYPEDEFVSYTVVLRRMKYHVEECPRCHYCGKKIPQIDENGKSRIYCSSECYGKSDESKDKRRKTTLDKYGVDNVFKDEQIKKRCAQTCLDRYGVDNVRKSEKTKKKIKKTNLERYGVEHPMQTEEFKNKIRESKKKNGTTNSSEPERKVENILREKFPNLKTQYNKDPRYPFACDFYIPSLDLFIEYEGNWTHGFHIFNPNNEDDINTVNKWKSRSQEGHEYYTNAIKIWTISDPKKRDYAKKNNLNYIEFWSIDEAKEWIKHLGETYMRIDDEYILAKFVNKKGYLNTNNIQKINDEEIDYLLGRFENTQDRSYGEIIYAIKNKMNDFPKCEVCGDYAKYVNNGEYRRTCGSKKCTRVLINESYVQTCQDKYGVDNISKLKSTTDKIKNTKLDRYNDSNYNNMKKNKETCLRKYGVKNYMQTDEYVKKSKETCLRKYGVDNYAKTDECKQKAKATCLRKYGDENYRNIEKSKETCLRKYGCQCSFQSENNIEKSKETCLKRYGSENWVSSYIGRQTLAEKNSSYEFQTKYKQTSLDRYGVEYCMQSEEFKERYKRTCLERYGVERYTQTEEFKNRSYNTKKKNHTFNSSKPELSCYELLKEHFNNVIHHHKVKELYPYNCDFYIKDIDTWIEYQGTWPHGGHPYDSNNIEDIDKANLWKSKSKHKNDFYDNALHNWTVTDPKKREYAKKNNLRYIEFWSIEEVKKWLQEYDNKS